MKIRVTRMSHEEAALLMPAFIRGRLDTQRQRQMQEHIAGCSTCGLRHREDLELAKAIERTPAGIELLLTSASQERNRQRLMENIASNSRPVGSNAAKEPRFPLPALALAMVAGLGAISIGAVLLTQHLATPEGYIPVTYRTQTTASPDTRPATEGPTYRVVFQPGASLDNIQRLLLDLDAVVVGGPTEAGVYTLAFPAGRYAEGEILGRLRQQPEIVFAEKSVHRDG